jgi:predicted nuclease of restriction endonuclease-like (RecB) superfamily
VDLPQKAEKFIVFALKYLQMSEIFCNFAKNFISIYAMSKIAKQSQINEPNLPTKSVENLFKKISLIIEESRGYVATAVKLAEVYSKYQIGKYIVEEEQQGKQRAEYGKQVLKMLSARLTEAYGDGWSGEQLRLIRNFYMTYSKIVNTDYEIQNSDLEISEYNSAEIQNSDLEISKQTPQKIVNTDYEIRNLPSVIDPSTMPRFILSWSHYLVLMRIKNEDERRFYEIEAYREQWSVRHLQRQYASSLYERLALSRNKDEVMRLSREGLQVAEPQDVIKNPITLEFLGLRPEAAFSEKTLENKIIARLQKFLLEMGKGFLFEARQKCFVFDEEFFYLDLVCYNRLLQCYVLIDLKMDKLTHKDLGQMQMYVNYYDRYVKQDFEKPTIGILLCKSKRDALVELTLPKDANIYAAEYALYLPDKKELQAKLQEWMEEFEE